MIESLNSRQRRALALAILVMILVLVHALTIVPLWALNRHYLDTIDRLESRLEILNRNVAADGPLRAQHDRLQRTLANSRQYLKSTTEALAAADLQGIVKRLADSRNMELLSTQILAGTEESGFTRVALKVRMRGTLEDLVKVFHALETSQPYLFLDNVSIRKLSMRRYTSVGGDKLDVDFDLIGYMPGAS